MADFPAVPAPAYTSVDAWLDPILKSRSRSGGYKGRRLQTGKKHQITLEFKTLSETERAAIQTHYDANRGLTFNFTWQDTSTTFVVAYGDDGAIPWKKIGPGRYDATIKLEEV
jgi:hypothetical protein